MLLKFTTSVLAALLLADQKKTLALARRHEDILEQNGEEMLHKIDGTNHLHQALLRKGEILAHSKEVSGALTGALRKAEQPANKSPSFSIQATSEMTEGDLDVGILGTSNLDNPETSSSQGKRHLKDVSCDSFCDDFVENYYGRERICKGACKVCTNYGNNFPTCICEVNPGIANYVGNFVTCVKFARGFD
jgi:hypothetical protein